MEINVKDPETGVLLLLDARPEQRHGVHGFRIRHPNHSGFFIANRGGAWRVMDDHRVEPELLANIGLALEGHSVREQVSRSSDDTFDTDNQPNVNNGIGGESIIDPNKP